MSARNPAERIMTSVRRGWWLFIATPVVLVGLTAAALPFVQPQYDASGWVRIDRERSPFRALEGMEALEFLTGGGSGLMTEVTYFQTRTAALEADAVVGVRFELVAPRGQRRSRLVQALEADPGVPVTELRFTRRGEGFELAPRVRQAPEVWRPFQRGSWTALPPLQVAPGGGFDVGGIRGRIAASVPTGVDVFVLRVHDDAGLFRLMERSLGVGRLQREADVVELRFRHADPEMARDVVNTLAAGFVDGREGLRTRQSSAAAALLEAQLTGVRDELQVAESDLLAFREREGVILPQAQTEGTLLRLAELEGDRDRLRAESQGLATLLAELAPAPSAAAAPHPLRRLVGYPSLLANPAASSLLEQLGELDNAYSALMATRTPADPAARLLEGRIREVEGQLRAIAETYLTGLERRTEALEARLDAGAASLTGVPQVELEFLRRTRDVAFLSELALALEVRLREAQVRSQVDEMGVQLIDPARAPEIPTQPRPRVALAMALFLGLVLGGAGAVVRYGL
jgi:uncharacterized protein involved in exopolysaccharide biosynthesis